MCPGITAIKYLNGVAVNTLVRGAAESTSAVDLAN